MSKLLSQLRRHFQKNSAVNSSRCNCATQGMGLQNQRHVGQGLSIIKYSALLIPVALLLVAVHMNDARILRLAREVPCGHVVSTIRIVNKIEMHTEVEKSCVDSDSKV